MSMDLLTKRRLSKYCDVLCSFLAHRLTFSILLLSVSLVRVTLRVQCKSNVTYMAQHGGMCIARLSLTTYSIDKGDSKHRSGYKIKQCCWNAGTKQVAVYNCTGDLSLGTYVN